MDVVRGQKVKLGEVLQGEQFTVEISLEWNGTEDMDIACFGLDAAGKLSDDRYFLFFNQLRSPEGALHLDLQDKGHARFEIDLSKLPLTIQKLCFTAAIDGTSALSHLGPSRLRLLQGSQEILAFTFSGADFSTEKAVMLFDIYRKDIWRAAAVAQGFSQGLRALLEHFGGEATDTPAAPPPTKTPVAESNALVSLKKVTLKKQGDSQKVNIAKKEEPQPIHINLNWDQNAKKKSGWFGSKTLTADLDLGCMYELQNGDRGVIQALGKRFGVRDRSPWIFLDKDDRSGNANDGENLFIMRPDQIKQVMIFTFIYEGAGNFSDVNGRMLLRDTVGNEISIHLDSPDPSKIFCAVCLLRHTGDALEIVKEERYFKDHAQADSHYHFGFQWKAGSKG